MGKSITILAESTLVVAANEPSPPPSPSDLSGPMLGYLKKPGNRVLTQVLPANSWLLIDLVERPAGLIARSVINSVIEATWQFPTTAVAALRPFPPDRWPILAEINRPTAYKSARATVPPLSPPRSSATLFPRSLGKLASSRGNSEGDRMHFRWRSNDDRINMYLVRSGLSSRWILNRNKEFLFESFGTEKRIRRAAE